MKGNLKLEILHALCDGDGIPMSERVLLNQLQMVCRPAPLQLEIKEALGFLESRGFALASRDALDDAQINWVITAKGRVEFLSRK